MKSGEKYKMGKPTSVNLDDDESEKLKILARKQDVSVSSLMRKLAKDLIKKEIPNDDNPNGNSTVDKDIKDTSKIEKAKLDKKEKENTKESKEWGFGLKNDEKEEINKNSHETGNLIVDNPSVIADDIKEIKEVKELKELKKEKERIETKLEKERIEIKQENRRKNMDDEKRESYGSGKMSDAEIEERVRKINEKDRFNASFIDMHDKIKNIDERVCKDGECTKNELANLKKDIQGLGEMRKDLGKLDELVSLKKDLEEIKGRIKKTDVCESCGENVVPHLASFCPNCGQKFTGWTNTDGTPVAGWKPYSERVKK